MYKEIDLVTYIKVEQLQWARHVKKWEKDTTEDLQRKHERQQETRKTTTKMAYKKT